MPVEEKVVIKVEVDSDIGNDLTGILAQFKALDTAQRRMDGTSNRLDRTTDRVNNRFKKFRDGLKKTIDVAEKFGKTIGKFGFLALAGQLALFTAGLLAAKAALITGRAAAQGYQIALKGVSVAAAAAATALAVAAAAMRQFQEAQLAPFLGGGAQGRVQAGRLSRGMGSRMTGLLGGEAAGAITGSLARANIRPSQVQTLTNQLYNLSGGDAKATQALAAAIGGGDFNAAKRAIQGAAGFQKDSLKNVSTMQGLVSAVSKGSATSQAFSGLGEDMASTFIGTLKTEFVGLKNIFADLGAPLLGPFRDAFLQISKILREDILGMTAMLQKFGAASFAPTLVTAVDKISNFIRVNIMQNLGNVSEMGESFVNWFRRVGDFFGRIGDYLRKLEPAADVVVEMFKAMFSAGGGRGLFQKFNDLITKNADNFIMFGEALGNLFGSLFDVLSSGQSGFFNKLPVISEILNRMADKLVPAIFNIFAKFAPLLENLPGAIDSLANVLNFLAPILERLVSAVMMVMNMVGSIPSLLGDALFLFGLSKLGTPKRMLSTVGGLGARALGLGGAGAARAAGAAGAAAGGGFVSGSALTGAARMRNAFGAGRMYGAGAYAPGLRAGFSAAGTAGSRMVAGGALRTGPRMAGLSAAFLGLDAISDFRSGGLSNIPAGFVNRSAANPLMQGLTVATALGGATPAGLIAGGLTTAGGSALGAYRSGRTGFGGLLTSAASGAALGAGIGMLGGPFAPLTSTAGAIIGAVVSVAATSISAWLGNNKLKEAGKKAANEHMAKLMSFTVGSGTEEFVSQQTQREALIAAITAGRKVDDKGNESYTGNTAEFRDYVSRFMGVDPNSIHLNDTLNQLLDENTVGQLEDNIERATKLYSAQLNKVAEITGQTAATIEDFMQAVGIDAMGTYNTGAVAGVFDLFNSPEINRAFSAAYLPDFSTSQQGLTEAIESRDTAYNALIQGQRSADGATIDQINDFVNQYVSAEVAMGGRQDVSGISAMQAIRAGVARGELDPSILDTFGIAGQESSMINRIAMDYGLNKDVLTAAYGEGGPGSVDALSNKIDMELAMRSRLRSAVVGGDMSAAVGINGLQATDFTENQLFKESVYRQLADREYTSIGQAAGTYGSVATALSTGNLQGVEDVLGKDASMRAMLDFMTASGDIDGARNMLLTAIAENTGKPPQIYVDGDLSTEERESVTYNISITAVGGGGSGGTSGAWE